MSISGDLKRKNDPWNAVMAGRVSNVATRIFVVLAIVVVVSELSLFLIRPKIVDTNETQAKQQLIVLKEALEKYRADNGHYPSEEEGLHALIDPPHKGSYVAGESALKDPWGRPLVYQPDVSSGKEGFTLYSVGPNGRGTGKPTDRLVVHN
jgi:general secretion pathway protein G